ncbi:hypothetical protein ANANG_G00099740 [Anguilla anguilla]|uniref:Peptide deformylase n=1 Tax=Anguilla anguilla TaxID=7936 RepID=A0A9D3MJR1_ANGAN|nr:hypothetical protein ANANG_G00099740 [Anguilla anguilla]
MWASMLLPWVLRKGAYKARLSSAPFWQRAWAPPTPGRAHSSDVKVRSYLQYLKRKIRPPPTPPYSHVCQVGDPVLRGRAAEVEAAAVCGAEVQKVIGTLDGSPAGRAARGLAPVPLRVFVNPRLRVLDSQTASFLEACESVAGFSACVPRYLSVEVSGLNEHAEPVTWQASGWPARILQHEMDHLDGVLYIDRMDSRTFTNIHWAEHNE